MERAGPSQWRPGKTDKIFIEYLNDLTTTMQPWDGKVQRAESFAPPWSHYLTGKIICPLGCTEKITGWVGDRIPENASSNRGKFPT